jgi:hypothetical protein
LVHAIPIEYIGVAPQYVSVIPQAGRCEPYTGDLCREIYGTNTQVYIPPGVMQTDIESNLYAFSLILNAMPRPDSGSNCVADAIALNCGAMFRECVTYGMKVALRGPDGYPIVSTAQATQVALPLTPPLSTCTRYKESCTPTPFHQWTLQFTPGVPDIIDCEGGRYLNQNKCIASNRTAVSSVSSTYVFNEKSHIDKYVLYSSLFLKNKQQHLIVHLFCLLVVSLWSP